MGRVINLTDRRVLLTRRSLLFFQCGTNPHFTYLSGDVDACGALDRAARKISCVDHVSAVHRSEINARVLKALL